jgi:hypothetical protein
MRQHQRGEARVIIGDRRDVFVVANARIAIDFTRIVRAPPGPGRIAAVYSVPLLVLKLVPAISSGSRV